MRPPPTGHMVINMKTTITTHGAHNGVIVHAGVQSGSGGNSQGQGPQWYVPSQFPQIETPSGSRMHTMGPGTSQENIATSWPALHISTATSPQPQPDAQQQQQQQQQQQRQSRQDRSPQAPPPPPPRRSPSDSPVYSFNGRDSPPDEFIQPTKVTLNIFNSERSDPTPIETSLRRSNTIENADALINDTVTTTTTVEVFRTPLDPAHPERVVALPPPPVPSIDDRPQLLRVNGPGYEKWVSQRTETLINDRPLQTPAQHAKAVQWKEKLVDGGPSGGKKVTLFDPYSGPRSPFANATTVPHPPSSHQYQLPVVNSFDERILPRTTPSKPPYTVQSPTEFSQVSHPVITSSQEDLTRPPFPKSPIPPAPTSGYPGLVSHPAIPDPTLDYPRSPIETPILQPSVSNGYEQVRRTVPLPHPPKQNYPDFSLRKSQTSPLYVEPNRVRTVKSTEPSPSDQYRSIEPPERYRSTRRSQSSHRRRRDHHRDDLDRQRHRSESPAYRQRYISTGYTKTTTVSPADYGEHPDPNRLPGEGPTRANSREIFRLYQTRDVMQNVVAQFDALGYGFGDSLVLSPLAESEDSVISELSSRADRTRSDILETKNPQETEEAKLRPLHRTTRATSSDDLYEELDHIYEELDNYRSKSIVTPEISDSSSTLKEEDSSESEECSGYAPVADIIEELKTPEVERVQPQQHLEQQEMTLSEYRPICRVRKAHPDGLMFPRITATVPTLPELPEEHEISTLPAEGDHGGAEAASVIPYVDESPRFSAQLIMPSDLTSTEEQSKRAVLRSQAQVVADQHKLVIRGWESLFSDSEESC